MKRKSLSLLAALSFTLLAGPTGCRGGATGTDAGSPDSGAPYDAGNPVDAGGGEDAGAPYDAGNPVVDAGDPGCDPRHPTETEARAYFTDKGLPLHYGCASCHNPGTPSGVGLAWGGSDDWYAAVIGNLTTHNELTTTGANTAVASYWGPSANGSHSPNTEAFDDLVAFLDYRNSYIEDPSCEEPYDAGTPYDAGEPDDGGQPYDAGQPIDAGSPPDGAHLYFTNTPPAAWTRDTCTSGGISPITIERRDAEGNAVQHPVGQQAYRIGLTVTGPQAASVTFYNDTTCMNLTDALFIQPGAYNGQVRAMFPAVGTYTITASDTLGEYANATQTWVVTQ